VNLFRFYKWEIFWKNQQSDLRVYWMRFVVSNNG
jgi:hypothetical protein